MRNLLFSLLAFGLALSASAQKVYFIYLQSDNGSPFYARMGDKIHSSSSGGYLILHSLVDSTYQLSIGFTSANSESRFRISLGARDKGFLIKNFDFGMGLFDMQSMQVVRPLVNENQNSGSYRFKNDDFTTLLSKAAKDTSLFWVPVVVKQDVAVIEQRSSPEEIKPQVELPQNTEPVIKKDTVLVTEPVQHSINHSPALDSVVEEPVGLKEVADSSLILNPAEKKKEEIEQKGLKEEELIDKKVQDIKKEGEEPNKDLTGKDEAKEFRRSVIKKYGETSTSEGFGLVYFDQTENGTDTIRLLIPNQKIPLTREENKGDEKQFLDITSVKEKKDSVEAKKNEEARDNAEEVEKAIQLQAVCPAVATEADFMKLRRNMAFENTDEAMVEEAKKYFKKKCFSTEQVRNLSVLFLTSAGKYLFFDAAYLHVTDQELFASLASEIRDEYYLKRFKALIGE